MMVLGGVEDVGDFLAVERKWMVRKQNGDFPPLPIGNNYTIIRDSTFWRKLTDPRGFPARVADAYPKRKKRILVCLGI